MINKEVPEVWIRVKRAQQMTRSERPSSERFIKGQEGNDLHELREC